MVDDYIIAKKLSDYVDQVIVHLALAAGLEQAQARALDHLRVILQGALDGTSPSDMAFVLMKPEHSA